MYSSVFPTICIEKVIEFLKIHIQREKINIRPLAEPDFFLTYLFKKEDSEGRANRGAESRRGTV
ncbi:hypothetical protein COJ52_14535 [Bacillus cereus]|nr:hypothetical protein COJ52_14535 [Bacillus cereus]